MIDMTRLLHDHIWKANGAKKMREKMYVLVSDWFRCLTNQMFGFVNFFEIKKLI
jgi:hypothetical protein